MEEKQEEKDQKNKIKKMIDYLILKSEPKMIIFRVISYSFIDLCALQIIILTINGGMDFIPLFGWIIGGFIACAINLPFTHNIAKETKNFCENQIKKKGTRAILMNQIEAYRKAIEFIKNLSLRNNWERKVNEI